MTQRATGPGDAMRILYINHYAGSPRHGMEFRPYYLSREWVKRGHEVRIVAGSFSHVRSRQPAGISGSGDAPVIEWIDGIEYHWYRIPPYSTNGLDRVRNIGSFLLQLWFDAPRIASGFQPDVVIASSTYPMDIWVARRIARCAGARLVYEVHDLWPLSLIELHGMSPRHPFIWLCQIAENAAYRHADVVVSMLPKVSEHMAAHGLDLSKLVIVPNGVEPGDPMAPPVPLGTQLADFITTQRRLGRKVVGYSGSHGRPNALEVLLDAAGQLRDEPFAFVLVGDGLEKPQLTQRVKAERLERVLLHPSIPKAQIPQFLAAIDIAYIGWRRVPIYRFGIAPNKLLDYLKAGCVVLHSVEAGNDPVAESGCGISVPPVDPSAVIAGLRRLAALPVPARQAMGERGRQFVLRHHMFPRLADQFIKALFR